MSRFLEGRVENLWGWIAADSVIMARSACDFTENLANPPMLVTSDTNCMVHNSRPQFPNRSPVNTSRPRD